MSRDPNEANIFTVTYQSAEDVLKALSSAAGHRIKEFDINSRLDQVGNKGAIGQVVEEGILGIPINSRAEPDFANLELELKTIGLIQRGNAYVAKERLTIDTLNYMDVYRHDFFSSPVWKKLRRMVIMTYLYKPDSPRGDFVFGKPFINEFSDFEIQQLKLDYQYIVDMVNSGHAEDISESDTMLLAACTAGTGALISQPFSGIKAKQRKFAIKSSAVNFMIRKYLGGIGELENIFLSHEVFNYSFEVEIANKVSPYIGMTELELRSRFSISTPLTAKNRFERYVAAMLGINGRVSDTSEFSRAGIKVKTIRVEANGRIKESLSFPAFKFTEVVQEDWESSKLRDLFANTRYCFAVFTNDGHEYRFSGLKFWNFKERDIDQYVKPVFEKLKAVVSDGNIVKELERVSDGRIIRITNFPGMSTNPIVHVRPHGRDANDTYPLPVPDRLTGATEYTKQCFWINNTFLAKIIKGQ